MGSVKKELASGVFYTALAKYSGLVISLVVTAILARLLTPDDFGIVAIATLIIAFFGILSDLGIAPAIIQHKQLDERDLDNIFSFTIWSGLTVALLFFGSSWLIARYYDAPQLALICQALSANLLFAAMNIVPNALIYKAKRFRFVTVRTLFVNGIGGTAAVAAAYAGAGIYALLVNPIFSSVALLAINLRAYPRTPRLTLGLASLRKIFAFSAYQFGFNVINYFSRSLDKLMIGKHLDLNLLGYYEKSYRLMMLPLQNLTFVISPVMHPVFSEYQHDLPRLSDYYLRVVRLLAFVGFPLSAFLWFAADELILLFFGPQWGPSVPVFRILALSVGVQVILSTSGSIFQAANSTRMLFISGLCSTALTIAGLLVGLFVYGTTEAVAWSVAITFALNFVQCYYLMYRHAFRLPWGAFWRQLASPLALSALLAAILWGITLAMPPASRIVSLAIKAGTACGVWIVYIQLSGEYDAIGKLRGIVKRFKR